MNQYVQVALQAGIPTIATVFGIIFDGRQVKAIMKMLDDMNADWEQQVRKEPIPTGTIRKKR